MSEIFCCVIIYADKDISFGDRDCNSTKRKPIAAFPEENIDQKHEDREIQDRLIYEQIHRLDRREVWKIDCHKKSRKREERTDKIFVSV